MHEAYSYLRLVGQRGLLDTFPDQRIGDNSESIQRLAHRAGTQLVSRWDYHTAQNRVHEQVRLSGIRYRKVLSRSKGFGVLS